jgi:hypothetical protein
MCSRVLCVDVDGETLYVGGRRIALDGRPPLWRIVLALVAAQAEGRALGTAELFECGWPGERASRECRTNRVYVAVATLRRLGLRGLVVRSTGGYSLDAEVRRASRLGDTPDPM